MASAVPPELRVGSEIAGYRIESLISRGGMGVVYLAKDLRLERKAALKVLAPELGANEAFRRRFVAESQLAASLDHPNIVPIYGAGETEGLLWIAMRYVEGVHLRRLIDEGGRLAESDALSAVEFVGKALDTAHARGLVHRDVKPGNILLLLDRRDGTIEHVYLSDFGLTKRIDESSGITDTGQFVGTVNYVAPEQIKGGVVDGRADQYSLACVLFESLTGRPPFARPDDVATIYAHLNDPPPNIRDQRPDLPSAFGNTLATAMAKRREDRFETCSAFVRSARDTIGSTEPISPRTRETAARSAVIEPEPEPTLAGATHDPSDVTVLQRQAATVTEPSAPRSLANANRRRWVLVATIITLLVAGATFGGLQLLGSDEHGGQSQGQGSAASNPAPIPPPKTLPGEIDLTKNLGTDSDAAWSPDGRRIAFASSRAGNWDVYVINIDGTGLKRLTTSPATERTPTWTEDGRSIAYMSDAGPAKNIWMMNADGTDQRQITREGSENFEPAWSPDGTHFVFVSGRTGNADLFITDPQRTSLRFLVGNEDAERSPAWSPDGRLIAFTRIDDVDHGRLWVIDPEGGDARPLTDAGTDDRSPTWSPDSLEVAFIRRTGEGLATIFVVDADGLHERQLIEPASDYEQIDWSPDGKWIAFTTHRDGNAEVYLRPIAPG
ncbi:MAG TPA: protein kinase [Actinomycetota bacterium]|nr:protein kinase [Actinomycetota bacterium]